MATCGECGGEHKHEQGCSAWEVRLPTPSSTERVCKKCSTPLPSIAEYSWTHCPGCRDNTDQQFRELHRAIEKRNRRIAQLEGRNGEAQCEDLRHVCGKCGFHWPERSAYDELVFENARLRDQLAAEQAMGDSLVGEVTWFLGPDVMVSSTPGINAAIDAMLKTRTKEIPRAGDGREVAESFLRLLRIYEDSIDPTPK